MIMNKIFKGAPKADVFIKVRLDFVLTVVVIMGVMGACLLFGLLL